MEKIAGASLAFKMDNDNKLSRADKNANVKVTDLIQRFKLKTRTFFLTTEFS